MLIRFISSVRQKPKCIRDQYAFWTAIAFTTCIVCFWLIGLSERVNPTLERQKIESGSGPFSSFFSKVEGEFVKITETVSELSPQDELMADVEDGASQEDVDMQAALNTDPTPVQSAPRAIRIATTTASTTL